MDIEEIVNALEIQALANEEAAKRSPQYADWSLGVARGVRVAIEIILNTKKD
jgi:hypothetical protein